jgi:hypothetical protein
MCHVAKTAVARKNVVVWAFVFFQAGVAGRAVVVMDSQ